MTLLAIDPGSEKSAWLVLDGERIVHWAIEGNLAVVDRLRHARDAVDAVVIETIEPWGGFTGPPALETMFWVGRFAEAVHPVPSSLIKRSAVLRTLGVKVPAGQAQAAVRAVLIERWGGGDPRRKSHPLRCVTSHLWSALAAAVAYQETGGEQP